MSVFSPSSFAVGGGLLDDVDVVVKSAEIAMFDYAGTRPDAVPAIKFTLGIEDGEDVEQYWSVGKASDWMPSEDGKKLVAIGRATQINASSNAAILLKSIVDAGFPENKVSDDITCFEGIEGHVMRVPAPKRNVTKAPRADGKVYEDTILTFASITKLPWEKATGKKSASKKSAPAQDVQEETPDAGEEGDLEERTQGILLEILSENPDGVKKQGLPGLIFKKIGAKDPDRSAILQLAFKDDFLSSGPWTYNKGQLSL
jgi:hypothetical protein